MAETMRNRTQRPYLWPLVALLALLAAACPDVSVAEQELAVRHDRVADTLDAMLVMRGVAAEPGHLEQATRLVSDVLDGKRRVGLEWFFSLDLDPGQHELDDYDRELVRSISVQSEAFLDEEGRLGIVQRIHVPGATRTLDRINQALRESILEGVDLEAVQPGQVEGALLRIEAAQRGWTFLAFDGPQLVVRLPVTDDEVAEYFREVMDNTMRNRDLGGFTGDLESVRIVDGCVTVVLGREGKDSWQLREREQDTSEPYAPELRDAIRSTRGPLPVRLKDVVPGEVLPD